MDTDELIQKLGLKLGQNAITLHAPAGYAEFLHIPEPLQSMQDLNGEIDWIQAFYADRKTLAAELGNLRRYLSKDGQLWLSWPKKASKVRSDVDEHVIREAGLAAGLIDVKIASINETWSGLKFVYRRIDR